LLFTPAVLIILTMLSVLKKLFRRPEKFTEIRDPDRYEREKVIARGGDEKKRITLASSAETHQEILFYLAQHDPNPKVRQAVAANTKTPVQAAGVLAGDVDIDVRLTLAQRLVTLLPELSKEEHSQLYAFTVQALGTLALDEVLKIRLALSSALKDKAYAPPKVASQLARDIKREVSEPVLRFCSALTDMELLDIIKTHPAGWAVQAIAQRDVVSGAVASAVIARDDRPAGQMLLENQGAQIDENLLLTIVEKARDYPEWHRPIAARHYLPQGIGKALAEFADLSVRDVLAGRPDFDPVTIEEISAAFRRRLDFADENINGDLSPAARVGKLAEAGRLSPETLSDAIAMRDRELAFAVLAVLARADLTVVEKIFEVKAPKSIVALCWRAGLSMRLALHVQKELGHIQPKDLIYPRDGTDYPLSKEQMQWQLEFAGELRKKGA